MSRWYGDKECPRDPYEAYREGRQSRSWEHNPYEHGKYGEYDCQRAYEEFERGQRAKEDERREERMQEEREQERQVRAAAERAEYERQEYERAYYEQMEQARQEEEQPSPSGDSERHG